jgi:hypothetical protein
MTSPDHGETVMQAHGCVSYSRDHIRYGCQPYVNLWSKHYSRTLLRMFKVEYVQEEWEWDWASAIISEQVLLTTSQRMGLI